MNLANRIEGAAQPNGIAISESAFLRSSFKRDFSEAEVATLKGVGPVAIYKDATLQEVAP